MNNILEVDMMTSNDSETGNEDRDLEEGEGLLDYKKLYFSLRRRVKRNGLAVDSKKSFKKQMLACVQAELAGKNAEITALQKNNAVLQEKVTKMEGNDLMRKVRYICNARKPYSEKGETSKRQMRSVFNEIICHNTANPNKERSLFLTDMVKFSPGSNGLLDGLNEMLLEPIIASTIQKEILNPAGCRASADEMNRLRDYVERKHMQLSKSKKQAMNKSFGKVEISINAHLKVKNVKMPCNTKTDRAAQQHLRRAFPVLLPFAIIDVTIKVEHAMMETESFLRSIIVLYYCTEELQSHWHWFCTVKNGIWVPKFNHIELSTFYDSTPLCKTGDNCTGLYLRVLNAPDLVHKPEFLFILYLAKMKENSAGATSFLTLYSKCLVRLLKVGLTISLRDFLDERTLPKSTIALNGAHLITFGTNIFAADGKAQLWSGGCSSANSSYTPEWRHHQQDMVHPDFPVNVDSYVSFEERGKHFRAIEKFRKQQQNIFRISAATLKANKQMTPEQKAKQFRNDYIRIMKKAVRAEAARLQTGCVQQPFELAAETVPCPLHMDCNEYLRVLEHIVQLSARLTLAHWDSEDNPIYFIFGSGNTAARIPNVHICPADCPLVRVLGLLKCANLTTVAAYFVRRFTPPLSQQTEKFSTDMVHEDQDPDDEFEPGDSMNENAESSSSKQSRIRLIGEHIKKLSPIMSSLVSCLKPKNGSWPDMSGESSKEFKDRTVCHTYVHLLRCHSSLLSSWTLTPFCDEHGMLFVGNLFVSLVCNAALHKSFNTFLFAQVAPYKVKRNLFKFMLSPTVALNIGIYGKNEGGEHGQKLVKEHFMKWTDKRAGWMRSLLNQTVEIYISGAHVFPDLCPDAVNLSEANTTSWAIRFGTHRNPPAAVCCVGCGSVLSGEETEALVPLLQAMYSSQLTLPTLPWCEMHKNLSTTNYASTSLKIKFMFGRFLKVHFDKCYCSDCVNMCCLLFALHCNVAHELLW
jgi:hypothetical protein